MSLVSFGWIRVLTGRALSSAHPARLLVAALHYNFKFPSLQLTILILMPLIHIWTGSLLSTVKSSRLRHVLIVILTR